MLALYCHILARSWNRFILNISSHQKYVSLRTLPDNCGTNRHERAFLICFLFLFTDYARQKKHNTIGIIV